MKREDISDAMAYIGDGLLQEADAARGAFAARRRGGWRGWAALAACVAVVVFGAARWGGGSTVDGLPKLTVGMAEVGMGFEGYLAYDISELVSGNPWTKDAALATLPVFENPVSWDENGMPVGDGDAMEAALAQVAGRLGLTGAPVEAGERSMGLRGEGVSLEVNQALTVTLTLDPAVALPEGYDFGYYAAREDMAAAAEYLGEAYAALLGMESPALALGGGDYDINRAQGYQIAFYEGAGDLTQQLVNYCFRSVAFYPDEGEGGNLWLLRVYLPDLSRKLGDYPIISVAAAEALLAEGHYITSVPYELPGMEYVEKVELVYRSGEMEACWMPYYRFYARLPQLEEEDGLQTFGAYYVPAVEGRFLTDMPVWDGAFNG